MDNSLKQPIGLYIFSLTELWERFGFYAIQVTLVLYLVHQLHFSDKHAYSVYTAFTSLLYAGPVLGGILADRFITLKQAILLGIVFFIVGYFMLMLHYKGAIYFAFSVLIGGNSYMKANITAILGTVYHENDIRRDSGFTIFYLIMNIGQVLGPICAAIAIKYYGYDSAFFISGVSLILCLFVFILGMRYLEKKGFINRHNITAKGSKKHLSITIVGSAILLIVLAEILHKPYLIDGLILVFCVLAILYLIYSAIQISNREERFKLFSLIILFVFSAFYWGLWMQEFTSMTLFIDRDVNRYIFGWRMPTEMILAIEGLGIIIFGPLLAKLWMVLGDSKYQPSFPMKFAYGFLFTGFCFSLIVLAIKFDSGSNGISLWWIIISFIFLAIGELCLSAIGLSAVTVLSPKNMVSTMMGFWFLSISAGLVITDKLANLSASNVYKGVATPGIYYHTFFECMILSFLFFIILVISSPFLKKISGNS